VHRKNTEIGNATIVIQPKLTNHTRKKHEDLRKDENNQIKAIV
jgi:hypothetical protein